MTYDPTKIAREAVYADCPELRTGLSDDMVEADRRAKLILTAAARMLRESGTVDALNEIRNPLTSYVHGDNELMPADINMMLDEVDAALANLAKLEGRG